MTLEYPSQILMYTKGKDTLHTRKTVETFKTLGVIVGQIFYCPLFLSFFYQRYTCVGVLFLL